MAKDRHEGMREGLTANYGDEELADSLERHNKKKQAEQEAAEAETGTD